MATLRLVPATGDPVEITRDQVSVGRDMGCDVVVNDGSVSRKHARIERRGEVWTVVDQSSANGTFVDSQRVADAGLRNGQELRFGAVTFRVEIPIGQAREAGPALPPAGPEATIMQPVPLVNPRGEHPTGPLPVALRPPVPQPPPPGSQAGTPTPRSPMPPPPRPQAAPPPPRPAGGPPVPPMGRGAPQPKGKSPVFWAAAGCGCLLLILIVIGLVVGGFYFSNALKKTTQATEGPGTPGTPAGTTLPRETPPTATPQLEAPPAPAAADANIEIETKGISKTPGPDGIKVEIKVRASGFAARPEAGAYRIDLVEDLETLSPDGERIDSLSKQDLQRVSDTTTTTTGLYADFRTTLPISPATGVGTYRARITIRDLVGGGRKTHEITFDVP